MRHPPDEIGKELTRREDPSPIPWHRSTIDVTARPRERPSSPMAYLTHGERCLIRTRLHWLVPVKSIVQSMVGMPLALIMSILASRAAPGVLWVQVTLWAVMAAHQLYLAYCVLSWRHEQILITDLRVIKLHGVFTTSVASVHLSQITATDYHRSILGWLFNYGSIEIKTAGPADITTKRGSAGPHKTLERIDLLPSPLRVYQAIRAS